MYEQIILMLLLIGLNLLIVYLYSSNRLFPVAFMLFEIFYGVSIIAESETYMIVLLIFSVMYNLSIVIEQRRE